MESTNFRAALCTAGALALLLGAAGVGAGCSSLKKDRTTTDADAATGPQGAGGGGAGSGGSGSGGLPSGSGGAPHGMDAAAGSDSGPTGPHDAGGSSHTDGGDDMHDSGAAPDSGNPPIVIPPGCGDGHKDKGEDCDDGAESATCNVDCTARSCGDHKTNATAGEECDDGKNGDDADGCTDACAWSCTSDDDCGAAYGGHCTKHACVARAFASPVPLMMASGLSDYSVVMDGHGNALAVWNGAGNLHHAWFTAAGGWGAESVLVANGKYPRLGTDGRGNALLAYTATDPDTAKLEHVRMRRYRPASDSDVPDPSGWRDEYTVKSYSNYVATGTDWISPAVAVAGNGDAWLAWRAQQQTGGGMGNSATWVARCANGGDDCAAASSIDSATRLMGNPQIALDNAGLYPIVTWELSVGSGENSVLRGARYQDTWSVIDAATATWPDRVTPQALTADGTGKAWFAITRVTAGVLSGTVLTNRRASLVSDFAWSTPQDSPRMLPLEIAADSAGDLIATVIELKDSNATVAYSGAALSAGTQTWSSETPLDSFAYDPYAETPSLALDGYGHGLALWVTSNGAQSAVTASRVLHTSSVSWSPPDDVSARTGNTLSKIQVALEADGRGMAMWLEDDGNQVTLWASAFQ